MKNDNSIIGKVAGIFGLAVAVIAILTGWVDLGIKTRDPVITIENKLALPIIVTVNDNSPYTRRIEPGASQVISLLSDSDFPAHVEWSAIRNKNSAGQFLGETLQAEYKKVDKEKELVITNQVGVQSYIYPKVINNTDQKCLIVVNDGLVTQAWLGYSSPQTQTIITGYYEYATNSNVTVKCPDQTYWRGKRNGKTGPPLNIEPESGIIVFFVP